MKLETLLLTRLQVIFHFCKRFGVIRPTLKLLDESTDSTLQPEYLAIVKSRPGGKKHRVPENKTTRLNLTLRFRGYFTVLLDLYHAC